MIALAIIIIALFPIVTADPGPPYILTFTAWSYAAVCDLNNLNNVSAYGGYEVDLIRDANGDGESNLWGGPRSPMCPSEF